MPSPRYFLDFLVMGTALLAGPYLLRLVKGYLFQILRVIIGAGTILLLAGFAVTYLQSRTHIAGFRWMLISGLAFSWSVAVILATAIGYCLRQLPIPPVEPERRKLLTLASGVVMAAPAALLGYGIVIGRREFRMQEVELVIPGLAPDLEGLRLAQLSDIHLSPFLSRTDLRWCVDMANEMRPHLAFVTGDLITGIRDSVDDCLLELNRLHTDAGIFGCMGNHESYIGAERYTTDVAADYGMHFLRQQRTSLKFGSSLLNIAGVDHQTRKRSYLARAEAMLRPGELNLLMSHNPDVFAKAAEQGWDVTLSGHMHGGQINLELMNANLNLARLATPWVYGKYRIGSSSIYVTRGIGTVGTPVRLGAPPEVALIRLRRGPAAL